MNILILGSGGREHTFAWKISQSSLVNKLFVAPGNAGTENIATNIPININDFEAVKKVVLENQIVMVIVGPEDPLVNGIHDYFLNDSLLKKITVIGPQKLGATLEGSKDFAKKFMQKHHIPTAAYNTFTANELESGYSFLETLQPPYVLKADGLAAGKGVLIIDNLSTAKKELKQMLVDAKFGTASTKVVIEEFLNGIELSVFVLTDGKNHIVLPTAKDYKRIGTADTGLNTGGMGAISPVPFADNEFMQKIETRIIKPTIEGLQKDNIAYKGFIFIGLIKVGEDPYVIEYNVRMGDPETAVVLPRIKNDLVVILNAMAKERLNDIELTIDERTATTVVAVSGGYPETYEKDKEIKGLESITKSVIFHAGTKIQQDQIVTSGGRVLAVTSYGTNFKEALNTSYNSLSNISFDKMYFRTDLGFDL